MAAGEIYLKDGNTSLWVRDYLNTERAISAAGTTASIVLPAGGFAMWGDNLAWQPSSGGAKFGAVRWRGGTVATLSGSPAEIWVAASTPRIYWLSSTGNGRYLNL